jgi:hypothetical protein
LKKKVLAVVALTVILATASMVALAQAWWPPAPMFVPYSLSQIRIPGDIISMDNSSYPIILIESSDTLAAANLTIGDTVYTYPDDFTYNSSITVERNALTGEAAVVGYKIFTFNLPGQPTLESWLVLHMTGLIMDPNTGMPVDPSAVHSSGQFRLTGTGRFASVDGFGLENDDYHWGYIRGWNLK